METREVSENKKKEVQEFLGLLEKYPIVGILNLENMPSSQFQKMRSTMRDGVLIRMTKKRLLKIVFSQSKVKGIEKLTEKLVGMPAILFTKDNPFKLYKIIKKSRTPAAAKPGSKSPRDISIPAGPTSFAPGPIISELSSFGLKAGVVGGKIEIKEEKVVVKEGEVISDKLVGLFAKFAILPMEIGLDLVCVLENGVVYDKKVLNIDEKKFVLDITQAAAWAFNLSVEAAYPTKQNIELLIGKAFTGSKAVALESNFMADIVAEELVMKAERQMLGLKAEANIVTEDKKKDKVDDSELKKKVKLDIEKIEEALPVDIQKAEELVEELSSDAREEADKEIEALKQVVEQGVSEAEKAIREEEVDKIVKEDTAEMKKAEELAKELVRRGTLRDVPSARELAAKKSKKQNNVPSAHELAEKLKKKS